MVSVPVAVAFVTPCPTLENRRGRIHMCPGGAVVNQRSEGKEKDNWTGGPETCLPPEILRLNHRHASFHPSPIEHCLAARL